MPLVLPGGTIACASIVPVGSDPKRVVDDFGKRLLRIASSPRMYPSRPITNSGDSNRVGKGTHRIFSTILSISCGLIRHVPESGHKSLLTMAHTSAA